MEVIYKNQRIKLPFIKCIKIEYYKIILKLRRFWRRICLLLNYFKKYIIILLCVIAYIIIVTLFGIYFDKYKTLCESIWENKEVVFTSLILPYFAAIYVEIKDRNEKLYLEHYFYENLKVIVAKYVMFFKKNITNYETIIFEKEIESELQNSEIIEITDFFEIHNEMNILINNIIVSAKKGELECDLSDLYKRLKNENVKIHKIYKEQKKLKNNDIKNFQINCNIIFHNISWMWTRDDDIHKKINKVITS